MKNKIIIFLALLSSFNNYVLSSSSYPYISGDSFRSFAQHVYDNRNSNFNPSLVKDRDIVFVKTDFLEKFFSTFHPLIKQRYILITHNSDDGIPGRYSSYLNDPKIIAWFGQNVSSHHPKLIPIPIGIANPMWRHGNIKIFDTVIAETRSLRNRDPYSHLIYMNFSIQTNKIRKKVHDLFVHNPYCFKGKTQPIDSYLQEMAQFCFTLSPEGNGLDCVRTWEALLVGSIPIVKSSTLDPLFKDLPVLIINDWERVTANFLVNEYHRITSRSYNLNKIYVDYWFNLITSFRNKR